MSSLMLLFPDLVQIEVMTPLTHFVCIVDPQYADPDPICLSQITEGGSEKNFHNPVFTLCFSAVSMIDVQRPNIMQKGELLTLLQIFAIADFLF